MYSDIFLNTESSVWTSVGAAFASLVIVNLLGLIMIPEWRHTKKTIAITLSVTAIIMGSFAGSMMMVKKEGDRFALQAAEAMKSSVADRYELELIDTPHFDKKAERTQAAKSSFKTPDGDTVDMLLWFEEPDGRAVVVDPGTQAYEKKN